MCITLVGVRVDILTAAAAYGTLLRHGVGAPGINRDDFIVIVNIKKVSCVPIIVTVDIVDIVGDELLSVIWVIVVVDRVMIEGSSKDDFIVSFVKSNYIFIITLNDDAACTCARR